MTAPSLYFEPVTKTLYVKANDAGIPALRLLADAPSSEFLTEGGTQFLSLDWAISWHEQEIAWSNRPNADRRKRWPSEPLKALRAIKAKHEVQA